MASKKPAFEAAAPAADKKKALETALLQIEKNFGKGTVMRLGDKAEMNVDAIPTGSLTLDLALGIGGVPRGRIVEIYGPESSGKTTLTLHIIAEAQKNGGKAPLTITGTVPDDFIKMEPKTDTEKIRTALENGETFDWAHLEERGVHLAIR